MNVLLVEPSYKNKYPLMGLMKISRYRAVKRENQWEHFGVHAALYILEQGRIGVSTTDLELGGSNNSALFGKPS